jgi:hypothetical protein
MQKHYRYQFTKEVNSREWCGGDTQLSTYIGTFRMNEQEKPGNLMFMGLCIIIIF